MAEPQNETWHSVIDSWMIAELPRLAPPTPTKLAAGRNGEACCPPVRAPSQAHQSGQALTLQVDRGQEHC